MRRTSLHRKALVVAALVMALAIAPAAANPPGRAPQDEAPPGSAAPSNRLDPHGWVLCNSWLGEHVAEDLAWIRGIVRPSDAQREAFAAFVSAAGRAQETVRRACADGSPVELDAIHRQIDAMIRAAEIICPAYDALYQVLSDDQKHRLDSAVRDAGG